MIFQIQRNSPRVQPAVKPAPNALQPIKKRARTQAFLYSTKTFYGNLTSVNMSAEAAALAYKVHEWATQELCLNPPHGQQMPSPEDIRKILRGHTRHHATPAFDCPPMHMMFDGVLPVIRAARSSFCAGPLPSVFSYLVNNAVASSKARDIRSNIRISNVSRQNAPSASDASASNVAKHSQMMQEIAALRAQLSQVQADSAGFCRCRPRCRFCIIRCC